MPPRFDRAASRPIVLLALWGAAAGVVAAFGAHFWIPLDDGTLAQSAERVLAGQLPHRDFADPYSGLNAVLGALALRLFGVELASLRIPLLVGFAAWLPGVWAVARRFGRPGAALAATGVAASLSVMAYPAAMPTWFALFFVTWGVWATLRWMETDERRWLVLAGALGGVAVLFKVVGLYFVAALLLTAAFRRPDGGKLYFAVTLAGVAGFLAVLARLVLRGGGPTPVVHFFLPALALGAAAVGRSRPGLRPTGVGLSASTAVPGASGTVQRGVVPLAGDGAAVLLGAFLPVLLFLLPYLFTGSAGAWIEGVYVRPTERLGSSAYSPPGPFWTVLPGLAAVGLVALAGILASRVRRWTALALAAVLAVALGLDDASGGTVFGVVWYSARSWIPALALWAAWRVRRPEAYLVAVTAALWALVQFPYTAPAYFFYAAPLGALATLAVAASQRRVTAVEEASAGDIPGAWLPLRSAPVLLVFAGLYGMLGVGYAYGVVTSVDTPLPLERGGIYVASAEAAEYEELVSLVREHLDGGTLYVTPDAPEVYFLVGAANPTGVLYEFLSGGEARPAGPRAARRAGRAGGGLSAGELRALGPRIVVFNTEPLFSQPAGQQVRAEARRMLPDSARVGRFVVRWRGTAEGEGP